MKGDFPVEREIAITTVGTFTIRGTCSVDTWKDFEFMNVSRLMSIVIEKINGSYSPSRKDVQATV
jgi:hypothetical protein